MVLYPLFFFFNDTATTEIYTLSLHDALPISAHDEEEEGGHRPHVLQRAEPLAEGRDRKSTRLNSSHRCISYAVFCLKKKKIFIDSVCTIFFIRLQSNTTIYILISAYKLH